MKKLFLTNILCVLSIVLIAQDITITFKSKSDTVSIDSISAINLRTNQMVKILGSESLLLVKTSTGINQAEINQEKGYIYPNPTDGEATFCFSMYKSEEVEIRLHNASGQLLQYKKQNLSQGTHRFLLKFPLAGMYYISLIKNEETTGYKAIYTGSKTQNTSILYDGADNFNLIVSDENKVKNATTDKSLVYTEGDVIQYLFFSGSNTTVVSDIPSDSKTIEVDMHECIDADGRSYKIVQIGSQWWMAENLNVGKIVNGDGNTNQLDNGIIEKYSYQNLESNLNTHGGLYQWDEMMGHVGESSGTVKGICPNGWHLPSKDEWLTLFNSVGGMDVAGKKLKSVSGYNNSGNGTDEYGFNALPSGMYAWDGKQPEFLKFMGQGDYSAFYTSTSIDHMVSYTGFASNSDVSFMEEMEFWGYGLCVRCILGSVDASSLLKPIADFTTSKTNITKGEAIQFTDKSTNTPTSWSWDFDDGTTSTEQNPSKTYNSVGTFTVSLQATNSFGYNTKTITVTVTEPAGTGTLVYEGRTYKTVIINGKEWMAENLAYLPAVYPSSSDSNTDPRYYVYDYQGSDVTAAKATPNYTTYGVLYNWPAAMAACPSGWHLPSDAEWTALTTYLGGENVAGGKMKESGTTHWLSPNKGASNESGFSGLPGGYCINGNFYLIGSNCFWWSVTELSTSYIWFLEMYFDDSKIRRRVENEKCGFSVRYIRDSDAPVSNFYIFSTAIIKGQSTQFTDKSTNTPTSWLWDFGDGTTSTEQNPSKTYNSGGTFTVSLQATNSFGYNTKTITVTVTEPADSGTMVYEGRTYKTIVINGKEWMAENLAYLPAVYPSSSGSNTDPRYYVYDYKGTDAIEAKTTPNYTTYGVLYNWSAAKAACPPGWHLPSDDEWTALTTFLGGENVAGGKMKEFGTTHWLSPNTGASNESGFSGLPGGYRSDWAVFQNIGGYGRWWSSSAVSPDDARSRTLLNNSNEISSERTYKEYGLSVRYVKD